MAYGRKRPGLTAVRFSVRERSTTTGSLTEDTYEIHYTLPGDPPVLDRVSYGGIRTIKEIADVVTSGFFSLKRCGKFLPINPVVITTSTESRLPGSVSYTDTRYSAVYTGEYSYISNDFLPVPEPDLDLVYAATLAAVSNAAAAEWDVLTFLAEFKKSAELMGDIGRRFNRKTFDMARQARRWKRNPWGRFREIWLESRYGIRPIVYDFKSAYKAFTTFKDKLTLIKGKGSESDTFQDEHDTGYVPVGIGWEKRILRRSTMSASYHGSCYLRYSGDVGAVGRSFGADPLLTAWELVPYSFVVDWFINIGAYVSTIQPQLRGNILGIGSSYKIVTSQSAIYSQRNISGHHDVGSYGPATNLVEKEYYVRYPSEVPFPSFLPKLTLPKIVDLVALFAGGRAKVMSTLNR